MLRRKFVSLPALAGGLIFMGQASVSFAALPSPVATGIQLPVPSAVSFGTTSTFGPDGLLYAYDGLDVWKEGAGNANSFAKISTSSAQVDGSDAGPIEFTRDGATIVVGTGAGGTDFSGNSGGEFLTLPAGGGVFTTLSGTVSGQFTFAALPASSTVAGSANKLAVDYGDFSSSGVSYFDRSLGTNTPVITGIPGSSTSVAFDNSDHLYVGVGFGAKQGQIRRFNVSALDTAFGSNPQTPLDFTTDGTLINGADNNTGNGFFVANDGYVFAGNGSDGFIAIAPDDSVINYHLGAENAFIAYNPTNDQFALISTDYSTGVGLSSASIYNAAVFVPEPTTLGVLLLGGMALLRRRAA